MLLYVQVVALTLIVQIITLVNLLEDCQNELLIKAVEITNYIYSNMLINDIIKMQVGKVLK